MQAWIDLTTSSFQFERTGKNSDRQRKMARIMCIRETDAERSNGREGESDFGCEISIDPRNAAIIRGRGRGATYAHLRNIDDISIRAWCIIYTCGRGERVAVERVATGGNRHHRSGSGID